MKNVIKNSKPTKIKDAKKSKMAAMPKPVVSWFQSVLLEPSV